MTRTEASMDALRKTGDELADATSPPSSSAARWGRSTP